jgi:3-deoxy-manno-octulosonate cytidylyltransferase (CMP-KDO synthetase)
VKSSTERAGVTIIIPARYASVRYPGKPLVPLRGRVDENKTLIQRTWEAAMAVPDVDAVYVATDDPRIEDEVLDFGGKAIMTDPARENGTARCAEALTVAGITSDIIINIQGDSPLTPSWFVVDLINEMKRHPDVAMATPVLRCDYTAWSNFTEDRRNGLVGGTTAVFDGQKNALYFSKEVIPYTAEKFDTNSEIPVFHHVGVYAYRRDALADYAGFQMGPLERYEGLEQLRFLENGVPVRCVEVEGRGAVFWELNNPVDVARIEAVLQKEA